MWPFDALFPNPADKAEGDLEKVPGTIKPYYQPYTNAGENSLNNSKARFGNLSSSGAQSSLEDIFSQLSSDPNAFIQKLASGFKASPGYQWRLGQGEGAINNAAAAGGMLGTPQHQQQAGELANNLASAEFQPFMDRLMGLFNTGVTGKQNLFNTGLQGEQHLADTGFAGASDLATSLAQALMNQGQLKYAGQANQNQLTGGLIGNLISAFSGKGGAPTPGAPGAGA